MADMASRIASLRSLLPELESTLNSFASSSSRFRIVRTVNPSNSQPKTLYILDSSFNPPSIAHLALATCAITRPAHADAQPHRLLLLFSTHNADKAPSAASFVQRLALMTIFAEDLSRSLVHNTDSSAPARTGSETDLNSQANIPIDIGLTKEPYYTDKSVAIASTSPPAYPSHPAHVHLTGYDTLIRFCNPKYYPNTSPPLSALAPFFEAGHRLRVTQRPEDERDKSSSEFGSVQEQRAFLERLRDGQLEDRGRWVEGDKRGGDGKRHGTTKVQQPVVFGRGTRGIPKETTTCPT
ncbi:hypothetical protein BCR34DRAFT_219743 [Clohesyomyces aquaticus]|uniref:Nicotinamide-nucleotide adenylyltransferase n=1 Tax=Clohesyomyces aquaticus TaxID=1231657 RepID=A0A1Y1YA86_9PLEO|nr:hypothetical protein BCR34DRAFT_219743 [Clohesyomyces aquaticus]